MDKLSIKYISLPDLCRKLGGRARSSIYRDLKLGRLPTPVRLGARLYWREHEVDEFLNAQQVPTGSRCHQTGSKP